VNSIVVLALLAVGATCVIGIFLIERSSYRLGLRHGRERAEQGMPLQDDEVR
jgi:hypothetical protein